MQPETSPLAEGVFTGKVVHKRAYDIDHAFRYPVWMALASLPDSKLPGLLRPRQRKYLSRTRIVATLGTDLAEDAAVWVLTQPSLIGRSFNPVSFYFITEKQTLKWIVAHITNTPWNEEHCYVLEQNDAQTWTFDKAFHVSPYMPMDLTYTWRFRLTAQRIDIGMHLFRNKKRVFFAGLYLREHPCSTRQALKLRLMYPLQNLHTLARIYLQAALLKIKGATFHAHPQTSAVRQPQR